MIEEELAPPDEEATPTTSASQVTEYVACKRRWAFRTLAKIRTPQTPAQALGDEVDGGQLQPYLRDGRPFDFTKRASAEIATSALAYLPQPRSPGVEVQKRLLLPSASSKPGEYAPFAYLGFIDLWDPERQTPNPIEYDDPEDGVIPIVSDFKTMGSLEYRKKEKTLRRDVQATIYATWAMLVTGARIVDLAWINMQTKGAHACKPTYVRITAEEVVERFLEIDAIAQELMATRKSLEAFDDKEAAALSLPPSPMACGDFGGCPHRHRCFPTLSPAQSIAALSGTQRKKGLPIVSDEPKLSLIERMRQKKLAAAGALAPPPAPTPVMGMGDRDVPAPPEDVIPPAFSSPAPLGINPPEKDLPPAPPVGQAAPKAPKAPKAAKEKAVDPTAPVEVVTATWAEERYSPVSFNSFGVGPFTYTTTVQPGETYDEAFLRAHNRVKTMRTIAWADAAAAYKEALATLKGAA